MTLLMLRFCPVCSGRRFGKVTAAVLQQSCSRAADSPTEHRTEPNRAEPSRTELNRAEPSAGLFLLLLLLQLFIS